jgi:cellulose synthase operon protein C
MAECEHLARTSAYFDGALDRADEPAATAHVATCVACQALLGDAVGIDAALSGARRGWSAPARTRRWPRVAAIAVVAAAAAIVVAVWPRATSAPRDAVAFELPAQRAVEARFTGPRFAGFRPRAAVRSDGQPVEPISLAALARLEQAGQRHDLIAALAATGDLARATELAATLPDDAASASDRAALALARGDAEAALAHAQHALALDPKLAAARWNLGLAAERLGLTYVARAAYTELDALGEPGWSDEARVRRLARAADTAIEDGFPELRARGKLMVDGGALLTERDAQRYPAETRINFYDAARVAPDRGRLEALRPLAVALDAGSGHSYAVDALARIDPAVAAKYAAAYRAVVARTALPAQTTRLIDELRAAGRGADDLRLGAIIIADQVGSRLAEVRAIIARWNDPWFTTLLGREEIRARYPAADPRRAAALREAVARCPGAQVAYRCGQFAYDLADALIATGKDVEAEQVARSAVAYFRTAMASLQLGRARAAVAELHRLHGRTALARAELEEMVLSSDGRDCVAARYARITQAELAIVDGEWAAARAALPPARAPEGCDQAADLLGIAVAVDLARATRVDADRAAAAAWLATAGTLADGGIGVIGAFRAGQGAAAPATAWISAHATAIEQDVAGVRAWGVTTLIDDAGARGAWREVLEIAAAPAAPCTIVASVDDDRVTVAVRTGTGHYGVHRRVPVRAQATAALVAPALVAQLSGCADIAVVARPPLHGRSDLLPPSLPWWFAGDAAPRAAGRAPARAVVVADAHPPDPSLPPVGVGASAQPFDLRLTGASATPSRVLAALRDATYAQLDVHGVSVAKHPQAAYLALSPELDGSYALRADAVAAASLRASPVIVLAACRAASVAPYLRQRWSLPDAFVTAGAHAVVAVDVPIPDADASAVFDELHRRIAAGEPVAAAVAALRARATAAWVKHLMVFR